VRHNSDDIAPILSAVRLMDRFFAEARQAESANQAYLDRLQLRYMELLNEDLARSALDLARALVDVEERITAHRRKYLGRHKRQLDRRQRNVRSKRR
jgi:hypothetical protein